VTWKTLLTDLPLGDPKNFGIRAWEWADMILTGKDCDEARDFWRYEGDLILGYRSAAEFVRDQLPDEVIAHLEKADNLWRDNPKRFNAFFKMEHARKKAKDASEDYVSDADGNFPELPRSHWWWWKLDEGATYKPKNGS
jgi:hypothetical protein